MDEPDYCLPIDLGNKWGYAMIGLEMHIHTAVVLDVIGLVIIWCIWCKVTLRSTDL